MQVRKFILIAIETFFSSVCMWGLKKVKGWFSLGVRIEGTGSFDPTEIFQIRWGFSIPKSILRGPPSGSDGFLLALHNFKALLVFLSACPDCHSTFSMDMAETLSRLLIGKNKNQESCSTFTCSKRNLCLMFYLLWRCSDTRGFRWQNRSCPTGLWARTHFTERMRIPALLIQYVYEHIQTDNLF